MEKLISIRELFKQSFAIYKNKLWTFITLLLINFVIFVPIGLLGFLLSPQEEMMDFNPLWLVIFALLAILAGIVSLIVKVALILLVKEQTKTLTIKEYLIQGWNHLFPFLWVNALVGLAVLGGCILLIVPGIIFAVWFVFSIYIVVLEGTKGKAALKESRELVRGYWWPIAGRFVTIGLLAMVISWIPLLGALVNSFVMMPLCLIYGYLMYEDLKRIKSAVLPMKVV